MCCITKEKETLSNRYTAIIEDNLNEHTFSRQQNQVIEIDGKSVQVNAYSVTLTKEQLNNLYLDILEQLKNDEIVLGKLDTLQAKIDQINQLLQSDDNTTESNVQSLKDTFTTGIDDIITRN